MFWLILIKVLIVTEICQSFTINQQSYYNGGKFFNPRSIQDEITTETSKGVTTAQTTGLNKTTKNSKFNDSVLKYGLRKTTKLSNDSPTINGSSVSEQIKNSKISQPLVSPSKSRLLSRALPSYKSGMISNILSKSQQPSVSIYQEPVSSNIYPVQYQYHNPLHSLQQKPPTAATVHRETNIEPVTAATLNIDILHPPKELMKLKYNLSRPAINYNNKIYHNTPDKGIENLSPQHYPYFIRKERNLNENPYDNDDKLIEHNFTATRDDDNEKNDLDVSTTAAASLMEKQPSSASHEIRYLHDIFLNYPKSHHVNYGHIELSPYLFEKRFESLKAGNRYKGEVIWLDNDGGYTQHYWDMAQGKL